MSEFKTKMRRSSLVLACGIALTCCVLTPQDAEARAGNGGSVGSMGSHTYQSAPSYNAAPIQRSYTQPAPSYQNTRPAYGGYGQPGYAQSSGHPFLSGLAGGFLGAGLFGMLFGHGGGMGGYGGYGGGGSGGFIGGLLQLLLIGGVILFVIRLLRGRMGGSFSPPPFLNGLGNPQDASFNAAPSRGMAMVTGTSLSLSDGDIQAFAQLLEKIQLAWGQGDLNHLRQYLTPEMMQYFSEELSANSSRGTINRVVNVAVRETRPLESWSEASLDYATCLMRWQAVDFMARLDKQPSDRDYVESGDAHQASDAQEVWTFARARNGGHWLLSAIQQVT